MIKNAINFCKLFLALLSIVSCSHQQVYESLQIKQKNDCLKVPESEYDKCMQDAEKPYEQYKEERQELKK